MLFAAPQGCISSVVSGSYLGQATRAGQTLANPSGLSECRIFETKPVLHDSTDGAAGIALKMGESRPLLNHVLDNYAHRVMSDIVSALLMLLFGEESIQSDFQRICVVAHPFECSAS